jgi:hypothetical protein
MKKHFPYLNFSESDEAIYEMDNSGYISPRRLVDAQIQNARQNGCHIFINTYEIKRNFCEKEIFYRITSLGV